MATSRYARSPKINLGTQQGVSEYVMNMRRALREGRIAVIGEVIATGADRLDSLAGSIYGDAKYWWVLAAASDIGWGLQVPPGTILKIIDIKDLGRF
jgi:hypothetical protein